VGPFWQDFPSTVSEGEIHELHIHTVFSHKLGRFGPVVFRLSLILVFLPTRRAAAPLAGSERVFFFSPGLFPGFFPSLGWEGTVYGYRLSCAGSVRTDFSSLTAERIDKSTIWSRRFFVSAPLFESTPPGVRLFSPPRFFVCK